jgi:hypothetical protein
MTIRTQITNDGRVWWERDHDRPDAAIQLCVNADYKDGEPWRSHAFSTAELATVCAQLQTFVVARANWFPLSKNPIDVAAFEKRLVGAEESLEQWKIKNGVDETRRAARADLLEAVDKVVITSAVGWGLKEALEALTKSFEEFKNAGAW